VQVAAYFFFFEFFLVDCPARDKANSYAAASGFGSDRQIKRFTLIHAAE
jgi:hypothetical protein